MPRPCKDATVRHSAEFPNKCRWMLSVTVRDWTSMTAPNRSNCWGRCWGRTETCMPRQLHKLSAKQAENLKAQGRHSDGGGLYLAIDAGERRRWVFMWRDRKTGKQREMGLGSAAPANKPAVSLARAREKAGDARQHLEAGRDPLRVADEARKAKAVPTFGAFADEFIKSMAPNWRNPKSKAAWEMTLREYAKPLRAKPVDEITVEDILSVLKHHWERRPETADRLRGRIERVLNAAKAAGHRTGENPAAWRGHLENLLPARPALSRSHHAAIPWEQVPAFMTQLRMREGIAARALEFTILTAARSGETRGARWEEFDLHAKTWTVPAKRMKAGVEHRVPLCDRVIEILKEMAEVRTGDLVFSGQKPRMPLSDMSLSAVLRRMKVVATVHGTARSSFKDWASEATSFPNELSEAALAHITGDKVERAYRRGDALERRRELMAAWATFCSTPAGANAVPLHKAAEAAAGLNSTPDVS